MKNKDLLIEDAYSRMKEIRANLGMTQREFGESADIDRRYVAKVECGSQAPSLDYVLNICMKHKISLDYIFHGEEPIFLNFDNTSYFPDKKSDEK